MVGQVKRRPILRWHGGKFRLAPWIISHFPEHRVYIEPFGGAGSVLLLKSRAYCEVYNDIDEQLFNLFQVLRGRTDELIECLTFTPFSRREFETAHLRHPDPLENARRLIIRSFMGFGADSASNPDRSTGFRGDSNRSGTTPAMDWVNYVDHVRWFAERFRGVVIECRDAFEIMRKFDGPEALFYVDPPYHFDTRKRVGAYKHEFSDHGVLLETLRSLKGAVVLSGYPHPLYESALSDWKRVERKALADGAQKRVEVLWIKNADS